MPFPNKRQKKTHVFSGSQKKNSKLRRRHFPAHANIFWVGAHCSASGPVWLCGLPTRRQLTNHRDFQLLPLMDEPVFQSGAIDVLAESGHWSSGQSSQIELHGGLEVPSYISFQFSTVHPFFHLISCTPCGKWLIKSVGKFLFPEWTFNSRFTSYSSSSFDD